LSHHLHHRIIKKRNHDQEFKIMKEISDTIKIEENPSLWYPIWNIPFLEKD